MYTILVDPIDKKEFIGTKLTRLMEKLLQEGGTCMQITPATKIVGLIGHPVAHSLSPLLHNSLYQSLGLDMVYHAFDVTPDKLDATAIDGFLALGFLGFNVTIPYKENSL
jgi:hypothetical protein